MATATDSDKVLVMDILRQYKHTRNRNNNRTSQPREGFSTSAKGRGRQSFAS
jgi:hypothetical protein